jgi:hypothetical protein
MHLAQSDLKRSLILVLDAVFFMPISLRQLGLI